jgi:hypothetical protein
VTAIIDFVIPADYYNQVLLITKKQPMSAAM